MSALASLSNRYATANPARAARVIESLPENEQLAELADLDDSTLAVIFDFFSPAHAGGLFNLLNPDRQGSIINIVQPRLAVVLLAQLDEGERETVMASMGKSERIDLQRQLTYPENSAGRLMDSVFNSCKRSMTVEETLTELRKSRIHRARSLNVIDDENRLVGRVDMQDLALEEPGTAIRAIMYPAEAVLSALDQRERIVELLEQSRLDSLPVVDVQGRLIGAVRYASLFSAIEEVAIAGMQKMVGNPDERALSPMGFAVKKRLPWLHINLLTAFLAAAVVGLFEDIISQFTALAILLPVVAGQSGNAGAQALAVTMRGLALREISLRDLGKLLNKEVMVGIVDGLVLAVTCGGGVYLWSSSFGLALVIGIAMILSMVCAGIAGAVVPILLIRAGQDPATASSIILTTVTDVAGFFSFLGAATMLSTLL